MSFLLTSIIVCWLFCLFCSRVDRIRCRTMHFLDMSTPFVATKTKSRSFPATAAVPPSSSVSLINPVEACFPAAPGDTGTHQPTAWQPWKHTTPRLNPNGGPSMWDFNDQSVFLCLSGFWKCAAARHTCQSWWVTDKQDIPLGNPADPLLRQQWWGCNELREGSEVWIANLAFLAAKISCRSIIIPWWQRQESSKEVSHWRQSSHSLYRAFILNVLWQQQKTGKVIIYGRTWIGLWENDIELMEVQSILCFIAPWGLILRGQVGLRIICS